MTTNRHWYESLRLLLLLPRKWHINACSFLFVWAANNTNVYDAHKNELESILCCDVSNIIPTRYSSRSRKDKVLFIFIFLLLVFRLNLNSSHEMVSWMAINYLTFSATISRHAIFSISEIHFVSAMQEKLHAQFEIIILSWINRVFQLLTFVVLEIPFFWWCNLAPGCLHWLTLQSTIIKIC